MDVKYVDGVVEAIIKQTMTDYMQSVRHLDRLKKELEEKQNKPEIYRQREKGESIHHYSNKKYRDSIKYLKRKIRQLEVNYDSAIKFFLEDIKFFTSVVDGQKILEELDEQLRQEGYEV